MSSEFQFWWGHKLAGHQVLRSYPMMSYNATVHCVWGRDWYISSSAATALTTMSDYLILWQHDIKVLPSLNICWMDLILNNLFCLLQLIDMQWLSGKVFSNNPTMSIVGSRHNTALLRSCVELCITVFFWFCVGIVNTLILRRNAGRDTWAVLQTPAEERLGLLEQRVVWRGGGVVLI